MDAHILPSGFLRVLPWFTMAIFVHIGGWIGDTPMSRGGLSITAVRKERSKKYTTIMQSMGSLGPTLFFLSQLNRVKTPAVAVLCMTCRQVRHPMIKRIQSGHRGVLLGLLNTAGVLAGVFGTAATGYILQRGIYSSCGDVLKVAVYLIGAQVWNLFATGEEITAVDWLRVKKALYIFLFFKFVLIRHGHSVLGLVPVRFLGLGSVRVI
ncbi:unnamed protein product [Brassica rapa subsp. narinosa]